MADDFRREQWGGRLKGTALGPLARAALAWAPGRAPLGLRSFLVRRATLPYFRARDEPFERSVNGATFVGQTRDMLNLYVFVFGVWEPYLSDFITSRLGRGDVFVDVGANAGWYTVLAAPRVGDEGLVIAVEPSAPIADRLERQVARNRFANVRVVREAVSDHVGRVTVELGPAEHTGLTAALVESTAPSSVPCRPLPDIVGDDDWGKVRLVKIDVEGAEFAAVRSLRQQLSSLPESAEVIVEVGPQRARSAEDVPALFATFAAAGFKPYAVPNPYGVRDYLAYVPIETLPRIDPWNLDREVVVVFSRLGADELPFKKGRR